MAATPEPAPVMPIEQKLQPRNLSGRAHFQVNPANDLLTDTNLSARLFLGRLPRDDEKPMKASESLPSHRLQEAYKAQRGRLDAGNDIDSTVIEMESGRYVRITTRQIRDAEDKPLLLDTVCEDVTDAVRQGKEETQDLIKANDEATSILLHELRSPLTYIRGYADMLAIDPDASLEVRERYLQAIQRGVDAVTNLTEDMLFYAKLAAGKELPVLTAVNTGPILEVIQKQMELEMKKKNAAVSIQPDMPTVIGDQNMVYRILHNYVSNAIKYGGEAPKVEITAEPVSGGKVKYMVTDHGPGIPKDRQDILFTPFGQVKQKGQEGIPSVGLGLSIVKKMVEVQGGTVGVDSEPGKGSTFYFIMNAASATPLPVSLTSEISR